MDLLKQENAQLKKTIATTKGKALEENEKVVQKWEDLQNTFSARAQLLKEHLAGRDKAEEATRWLSQVVGTMDCLEVFKQVDGLNISAERMKQLADDRAKYEAQVDAIEYPDIPPESFKMVLSSPPTHTATVQILSAPESSLSAET